MNKQPKPNKSSNELMRYAGWGTQVFVLLALMVYAGYKADKWLHFSIPLLVWLMPFVALIIMIWQLIKDTSKKKTDNDQKKV
jgi:hypothetical protein